MIHTHKDLCDCTNALSDWCKSQDLHPTDAMLCMEFFMALMITENAKTEDDVVAKLHLIVTSIQQFMALIKVIHVPPTN